MRTLRAELKDFKVMYKSSSIGRLILHKWKSSELNVWADIPSHLLDQQQMQEIICINAFTKVLGVEWNSIFNTFCPKIPSYSPGGELNKRTLVSDITRLYDVLGWCSPAIIEPKVLLQRLWEVAVKSFKRHFRKVIGETRSTF